MKTILTRAKLLIKQSPIHGYGVFADEEIPINTIIEECYVPPQRGEESAFENYYFSGNGYSVLPLGFGALYNHADTYNASYEYDEENQIIVFRARQLIKQGEEIFIHYGEHWFKVRNLQSKQTSWHFKLRKLLQSMPSVFRFLAAFSALLALRFL